MYRHIYTLINVYPRIRKIETKGLFLKLRYTYLVVEQVTLTLLGVV